MCGLYFYIGYKMLPYRLLFNIGSKAVGALCKEERKSQRKHDIAMKMATNERAKEWLINTRFSIRCVYISTFKCLAYATFYGDMAMLQKVGIYLTN